jgi:hypothetical protein
VGSAALLAQATAARGPDRAEPAPAAVAIGPASASPAVAAPPPSLPAAAHPPREPATSPPIVDATRPGQDRDVDPPLLVAIPTLRLSVPVRPAGVDESGAMALPARPDQLGWYRFGPAPGDRRGTAVLAGHVDSRRYGLGPLVALERLAPGDEVRVTLASGRTQRFLVTGVASIRKARLDLDGLFRRDGAPRLVLLTCGGRYDSEGGGYSDNVVVTAVPS